MSTTFKIYREGQPGPNDIVNWRWSLKASNSKIVAEGGEGYEKATDLARVVRKFLVRDDMRLEFALCAALHRAGLDSKGRAVKPKRTIKAAA